MSNSGSPPAEPGVYLNEIKEASPNIRIAMLTGYDFPEYWRTASQCGADRYFLKDAIDWKEVEEFIQYVPKENR